MRDAQGGAIETYRFGPFELDTRTGELRRDGEDVPLQPQPAGILAILVRRRGELVTREEIQAQIWPDRVVDYEQGLNYAIRQVRHALGDEVESPTYIETLPRRGYRFRAPVERVGDPRREPRRRRRMAVYALAGLLLAGGAVIALAGLERGPAASGRPTVAVLPFESLGSDASDAALAQGITEAIITGLTGIGPEHLGVVAHTSSARFGSGDPIERIAKELGVDYVLEGSLQRSHDTVRITAQLVRVTDRTHVWARTYDRPVSDFLAVQNEVGGEVIRAVAPGILGSWPVERARLPADPVVRESYLVSRSLLETRDQATLEKARRGFAEVLASEPDFAPALVGLGEALLRSGRAADAREPLERALESDPDDGRAHHLLAQVLLFHDWEWEAARRHLEAALRLHPGRASAYQVQAYWLAMNGRMAEASAAMETALRLDPLSSYVQADAGWIDYWAGRLEQAATRCTRTLELDPGSGSGRTCLLFVRIRQGDGLAAREAARTLMTAHDATAADLMALDAAPPEEGLRPYWSWESRRLEALPERSGHDAFLLALAYAQLGRDDEAFRELEAAMQGRTSWMLWLEIEPRLAPLRHDVRWPELVRRMDFPRSTG